MEYPLTLTQFFERSRRAFRFFLVTSFWFSVVISMKRS